MKFPSLIDQRILWSLLQRNDEVLVSLLATDEKLQRVFLEWIQSSSLPNSIFTKLSNLQKIAREIPQSVCRVEVVADRVFDFALTNLSFYFRLSCGDITPREIERIVNRCSAEKKVRLFDPDPKSQTALHYLLLNPIQKMDRLTLLMETLVRVCPESQKEALFGVGEVSAFTALLAVPHVLNRLRINAQFLKTYIALCPNKEKFFALINLENHPPVSLLTLLFMYVKSVKNSAVEAEALMRVLVGAAPEFLKVGLFDSLSFLYLLQIPFLTPELLAAYIDLHPHPELFFEPSPKAIVTVLLESLSLEVSAEAAFALVTVLLNKAPPALKGKVFDEESLEWWLICPKMTPELLAAFIDCYPVESLKELFKQNSLNQQRPLESLILAGVIDVEGQDVLVNLPSLKLMESLIGKCPVDQREDLFAPNESTQKTILHHLLGSIAVTPEIVPLWVNLCPKEWQDALFGPDIEGKTPLHYLNDNPLVKDRPALLGSLVEALALGRKISQKTSLIGDPGAFKELEQGLKQHILAQFSLVEFMALLRSLVPLKQLFLWESAPRPHQDFTRNVFTLDLAVSLTRRAVEFCQLSEEARHMLLSELSTDQFKAAIVDVKLLGQVAYWEAATDEQKELFIDLYPGLPQPFSQWPSVSQKLAKQLPEISQEGDAKVRNQRIERLQQEMYSYSSQSKVLEAGQIAAKVVLRGVTQNCEGALKSKLEAFMAEQSRLLAVTRQDLRQLAARIFALETSKPIPFEFLDPLSGSEEPMRDPILLPKPGALIIDRSSLALCLRNDLPGQFFYHPYDQDQLFREEDVIPQGELKRKIQEWQMEWLIDLVKEIVEEIVNGLGAARSN